MSSDAIRASSTAGDEPRVFQSRGSVGRSTAKYHWADDGLAACTSLPVADYTGFRLYSLSRDRLCRAKACAQHWQRTSET